MRRMYGKCLVSTGKAEFHRKSLQKFLFQKFAATNRNWSQPSFRFVPNMAKWGSTCNHNYLYRWLPCQYFILLTMGAWRPKHVEKVCSNKICVLLHHVGVLFNLIKVSLVCKAAVAPTRALSIVTRVITRINKEGTATGRRELLKRWEWIIP